ncbi:MAG: hypothetical protein V3V35_03075 [Dehalococcoidia bacterium]
MQRPDHEPGRDGVNAAREFSRFVRELRSGKDALPDGRMSGKDVLASLPDGAPPPVRAVAENVARRDESGPRPGDRAPDFFLKRMGTEERVRLSDFRGLRPVALLFGSYT